MARVFVDENNPSIYRDTQKCIKCGRCKEICEKQRGLANFMVLTKKEHQMFVLTAGNAQLLAARMRFLKRKVIQEFLRNLKTTINFLLFQPRPLFVLLLPRNLDLRQGNLTKEE